MSVRKVGKQCKIGFLVKFFLFYPLHSQQFVLQLYGFELSHNSVFCIVVVLFKYSKFEFYMIRGADV